MGNQVKQVTLPEVVRWLESDVTKAFIAAIESEYNDVSDGRARCDFVGSDNEKTINALNQSIGQSQALFKVASNPRALMEAGGFIEMPEGGEENDKN